MIFRDKRRKKEREVCDMEVNTSFVSLRKLEKLERVLSLTHPKCIMPLRSFCHHDLVIFFDF